MTADGTGDDFVKLEGMPPGEKLTFLHVQMPEGAAGAAGSAEVEGDPPPPDEAEPIAPEGELEVGY